MQRLAVRVRAIAQARPSYARATATTSDNDAALRRKKMREEQGERLRKETEKIQMAEEGCDWVEASAETAYLEVEPTERAGRAEFSVNAARNAHNILESAIRNASSALKDLPKAPLDARRGTKDAVINAKMRLMRLEDEMEQMIVKSRTFSKDNDSGVN